VTALLEYLDLCTKFELVYSGVATVGPTGACAPPSALRARSSAKDATHVILRDDLSQHYHAAVNTKKSPPFLL